MDPLEVLVARTDARRVGNAYRARCPAHDDKTPSLTITRGDRQPVIIHCHAGCENADILAALDLPSDYLSRERDERDEPEPARRANGHDGGGIRIVMSTTSYTIRSGDGTPVAVHVRRDYSDGSKQMPWTWPDGTASTSDHPIRPAHLPLYRTETLTGVDLKVAVVVTEGEKAADALARILNPGLVVGTVTGAASIPDGDALEVLRDRKVFLWPDHDAPGRTHMERIAKALAGVARSVWIIDVPGLPDHGDAADYAEQGRSRPEIIDLMKAAMGSGTGKASDQVPGMDAADLVAMMFEPIRWIVPGLLPEGTTVIAAPPKIGKSTLVYQLAVEVALGGSLFDEQAASGAALYYALEDGERRANERVVRVLDGRSMPRDRLTIRWKAPIIGKGLEGEIRLWLADHPDAVFVAIDTLVKVRPVSSGRQNVYDLDSHEVGAIQDIVRNRPGIALVIVHHTRKASGEDFVSSVSGSHGLTGAVDTVLSIKRGRMEQFGTVSVVGRDVEDVQVPVQFTQTGWRRVPAIVAASSGPLVEILRIIKAHGPMFAQAIVTHFPTGQQPSRNAVQDIIKRLRDSGLVVRTTAGYAAVESENVIDFGEDEDR